MALDCKGLISIHGIFKLSELALIITTFFLARLGGSLVPFGSYDDNWLGQMTTGGWLIINPIIILGIILDKPMSWILDSLFSLVGSFLFIASGTRAIDSIIPSCQSQQWRIMDGSSLCSNQLALGSFCIITGFV